MLVSASMRVIAGKFRSRALTAPAGVSTRPTSDRLRETLFNVVAPEIAGATFVDLYAGSGAVGIEAISRGAGLVYFVEMAEPALAAIRANLNALKIVSGYGLEPRSVSSFLRRQEQRHGHAQEQALAQVQNVATVGSGLNLVFLDPPYESDQEYAATLGLLGGECSGVLAVDSIVVAEHQRRKPLEAHYGSLRRSRVLEQGDAALSFYRKI